MENTTRRLDADQVAFGEELFQAFASMYREDRQAFAWLVHNSVDKGSPHHEAARSLFDRAPQLSPEALLDQLQALYQDATEDIRP